MAPSLLVAAIPTGDPDVSLFIVLMGLGFLVGVAGHVWRSQTLVATGIALVFLATIGLPLIMVGGSE
jgi:hypothetical protein